MGFPGAELNMIAIFHTEEENNPNWDIYTESQIAKSMNACKLAGDSWLTAADYMHGTSALAWLLVHQQPAQPCSERQPQAGSAEALTEAGSPSTAGEVFAHPHHPCTTVPYYWTANRAYGGTQATTQSVEVSKHRHREMSTGTFSHGAAHPEQGGG